ncbi:MAG: LD-carboxypeptidase, partial [Crocinitomicaceae bacterium]
MSFLSRRHFLKSSSLLGLGSMVLPEFNLMDFDKSTATGLQKPKKLESGDKIAVTAPGGAIWDQKDVIRFEQLLKSMGYLVVLGETLTKKKGYLAGTDEERSNELMSFFADTSIDGIIAMRGGWGCARLLDKLDYSVIQSNPKVLMGFSDITSLLIAIYIKTGLVTFHGLVGVNSWNEFSTNVFNRVVCNGETCSLPLDHLSTSYFVTLNKGKASGKLFGGNLSVISGLVGSPYFEIPENSILFLEETNEEPYVVDRLLTHLKLANVYEKLNGVVFGNCSRCLAENPSQSIPTIEVIREHFSEFKIPVSYGSPFGHIASKWTLPIGIEVEM